MIEGLVSGECRRVSTERPDIHVYCHHPMVEVMMPWGRTGWQRRPGEARYCVVCPDAGLEYLPYDEWVTADEAEQIVARVLYGDPRPTKRGAR